MWFHVPMKNPVRVQIVQGLDKLAGNHSDLKIPNIRNSHVNSGQRKTIILHVTKYMIVYKTTLWEYKLQYGFRTDGWDSTSPCLSVS